MVPRFTSTAASTCNASPEHRAGFKPSEKIKIAASSLLSSAASHQSRRSARRRIRSAPDHEGRIMTLADYSMTAFALLNGGRVLAYMPQILCVYRCQNGAPAVSLMTWLMFTAANLATVSYAITVSSDLVVA